MDKNAAEVFGVFFDTVILGADLRLLEKLQDTFFERAGAFARDDLHQGDAFFDGLADDAVQRLVDLFTTVEDLVEVEFELGHAGSIAIPAREIPELRR